jgi:hypothetical protein
VVWKSYEIKPDKINRRVTTNIEVVPVVGLEQIDLKPQNTAKPFGSGNFSKRCNDKEIITGGWSNQANNS